MTTDLSRRLAHRIKPCARCHHPCRSDSALCRICLELVTAKIRHSLRARR